jgi:hypothetical protein
MRFRQKRTQILAVTALCAGIQAFQPVAANEQQVVATVDPPLSISSAKPQWRWIGIRSNPMLDCPSVPEPGTGWNVTPLFEIPGNLTIPPGLAPYCLYERAAGVPTGPTDIMPLFSLVGGPLTRIQPDALAVAPYASELQDLMFESLEEHFLAQAGKPTPLPITSSQSVRLAFIDTAATNEVDPENFPGNSTHGFSLINTARRLLCDDNHINCLADVTSQLGLAYRWPAPGCNHFNRSVNNPGCRDEVNGGHVGMIGDLARAIHAETDRYLDVAPPGQQLVINLSVGWLPVFGGSEPLANLPVNVQAVYRALEYASCQGALVFAAAGNTRNGPNESVGPLYPGGWETRIAPRGLQCFQSLGSPPPVTFPPPANDRRSLAYGIGAIRSNGQPLFNIREEGEPRTVAFGDHAVVETPAASNVQSSVLTGTSVATAVVSAAAAATWYFQPNLPPHEVMDFIYGSGTRLGRSPDFCRTGTPGNPCPLGAIDVRQVSICLAAAAACAAGGPFCPTPGSLSCPPVNPVDLAGVDFTEFEATATETVSIGDLSNTTTDGACPNETINFTGNPPIDPCPHNQYHGVWAETWLGPQPGSDPCTSCTTKYASPGTFYIELDDRFDGVLTEPALKCAGNVYALPLIGPFVPGYKAVVTVVPCEGLTPVELSFTLNGDQSVTSPVLNLD